MFALPTITSLWFFLTPVVYNPPSNWPYSLLGSVNPVSPLLVAARDLFTLGTIQNIAWWPFSLVVFGVLLGLLAMWVLYRVSLPIIIERIGA